MLISYVIDEQTFLIVNREIVSEDIQEFTFCPTEDQQYSVTIFNEKNELDSLRRFFAHLKAAKPIIITTFNGDFFDFPFIKRRSQILGVDLESHLGIVENSNGRFTGQLSFMHMDCFYWVQRDAFLPHGSHGLKAVTKKKLGFDPIEVDPEEMLPMARSDPQRLCEYSVSDAICTYLLYIKQIHDFIFALCTIIPMNPDDVLRKGSGTLCENLLMVRAFKNGVLFPNKSNSEVDKFHREFLIESETYVGGFV